MSSLNENNENLYLFLSLMGVLIFISGLFVLFLTWKGILEARSLDCCFSFTASGGLET